MKKFMYPYVTLCILVMSTNTIDAASWFRFGSKLSSADRALSQAITDGDYRAVNKALDAKANPNAVVDGQTTLFVHAFEDALQRDENAKISGINGPRSDIARYLAAAGGNIADLNRDLTFYLTPDGSPLPGVFENSKAAADLKTFVEHLRNLAKKR